MRSIKAIIADLETADGRSKARSAIEARFARIQSGEMKTRSIEAIRQVAAIVDQKTPDEAAAIKAWLQAISTMVAAASKEGGFMGFGGVDVSDAEQATMAEIETALRG